MVPRWSKDRTRESRRPAAERRPLWMAPRNASEPRRSAMITAVALPVAELSSVASALDDLTKRVTDIARRAADEGEDSASELFAAERALRGAQRRLAKLATPSRRG